jgi:RND family efflux transporter MFP subunit
MSEEYKKTNKQRIISALVIVAIIVLGFSVFSYLMHHKKRPKRVKPHKLAAYVITKKAELINTNYIISAYGRILPSKKVTILPQVSGKIVYINPSLIAGDFVGKNSLLMKIDDSDYKLDVKIKQANLNKLKEALKIEVGKQKAAELELKYAKKFVKNLDSKSEYLILKKPSIKQTLDSIQIAKAELEKAKLNIKRTNITAPFNAYILAKYADLGSTANVSSKLVDLISSDEFYAQIETNFNDLKFINLDNSTTAKVFINQNDSLSARFLSLEKSVDEQGVMAKLLFSIKPKKQKNLILINNYINCTIIGKKLNNIFKIPIDAIRDDDTIWLYSKDSTLKIKKIDVVFKDKNFAYTYDLNKNDEIVVSNISMPIGGMKLKRAKKNESE